MSLIVVNAIIGIIATPEATNISRKEKKGG
jgi:hypothetical protein